MLKKKENLVRAEIAGAVTWATISHKNLTPTNHHRGAYIPSLSLATLLVLSLLPSYFLYTLESDGAPWIAEGPSGFCINSFFVIVIRYL